MNNNTRTTAADGLLPDELQTLWDEQGRSIDRLLAGHPEARPRGLNPRHYLARRRRLMAEHLALAILNLAACAYSLAALLPSPLARIRVAALVLAAATALIALGSLRQLASRLASLVPPLPPLALQFTPRHISALSAAAVAAVVLVSCSPVGDGHAMSLASRADRAAVVANIDQMLLQL